MSGRVARDHFATIVSRWRVIIENLKRPKRPSPPPPDTQLGSRRRVKISLRRKLKARAFDRVEKNIDTVINIIALIPHPLPGINVIFFGFCFSSTLWEEY